jgi:hypothetical protein
MLLSGVLAGLALGIAIGRDWRRLERLRVDWLPLLALALAARAIAPFFPFGLVLDVVGIAGTTAFAGMNWRLPGAALVAVGSLLNLVVIVMNGAMPFDVAALQSVGGRIPQDHLHVPLSDRSLLPILADIIAVPVVRAVYSVGDVIIATGGFLLPFVTLTRR